MHGVVFQKKTTATQVNAEELFLKPVKPRGEVKPEARYDLKELLYAIEDRAKIGRGIAILEDEVDNFNFIVQLVNLALDKL